MMGAYLRVCPKCDFRLWQSFAEGVGFGQGMAHSRGSDLGTLELCPEVPTLGPVPRHRCRQHVTT
jgi:hypothetical protein